VSRLEQGGGSRALGSRMKTWGEEFKGSKGEEAVRGKQAEGEQQKWERKLRNSKHSSTPNTKQLTQHEAQQHTVRSKADITQHSTKREKSQNQSRERVNQAREKSDQRQSSERRVIRANGGWQGSKGEGSRSSTQQFNISTGGRARQRKLCMC
jgi:hypothetical protein